MKRLQDTIEESLLDLDDKIMDRGLIEAWLDENAACTGLEINDDLTIDARLVNIDMTGPIPEYIRFNKVDWIHYYIPMDVEEVWLAVPKTVRKFQIIAPSADIINFFDDFECRIFEVSGRIETINLPKKFKCEELLCGDSQALHINGIEGIKAHKLELPPKFIKMQLVKTLKLSKDSSIKVSGRSL